MPPAEAPLRLVPKPPSVQGRVTSAERWATGGQFGDMSASQLTSILNAAKTGDVSRWADLCAYAISTDEHLSSLSSSRYTRVVQADWLIVPNEYGDQAMARLAAEFVNEQLARIQRYQRSMKALLSAVGIGYAVGEMEWARDSKRTNYVQRIVNREAHRFRYDEQWNLRLYDSGVRASKGSIYGEALDPRLMIVHEHQEVNGYPGATGVMKSCIWGWMFSRWVEKFNILFLEKFGSPIVYAKVDPDSKENVRNQILEDLQNLSNEHVGVIEGHEITLIDSATKSGDGYQAYLTYRKNEQTKAWLGTSDAVDPGANGSRAAVDSRTGAMMDPRMVSDGQDLAETLQSTLFTQLIALNLHKFGVGDASQVPVPMMRFRTADDEVKVDAGARAQESIDVREQAGDDAAPVPVAAPSTAAVQASQPEKFGTTQITSMIDLAERVTASKIPRSAAVELAKLLFGLDHGTAERVFGVADQPVTVQATEAPPDPKASAAELAVGDRVRVKPGKAHDDATAESPGTVKIVNGAALGIEFDSMPGKIHKWYTADELDRAIDPKATAPVTPGHAATQATGTHYPNPFAKSRASASARLASSSPKR